MAPQTCIEREISINCVRSNRWIEDETTDLALTFSLKCATFPIGLVVLMFTVIKSSFYKTKGLKYKRRKFSTRQLAKRWIAYDDWSPLIAWPFAVVAGCLVILPLNILLALLLCLAIALYYTLVYLPLIVLYQIKTIVRITYLLIKQ